MPMSYARVGLVAPPLLDRERTALSECAMWRTYIIYAYMCTSGPFSYQTCLTIYSLRLPQDDAASH